MECSLALAMPAPFVAIDRASKVTATAILDELVEAIPCAIESCPPSAITSASSIG